MQDKISNKLLEYLQKTEDFALEQLPEIMTQALKYEKLNALLTASLMGILIGCLVGTAWYFWRHPTLDRYGTRDALSYFGTIMPLLFSPLLFVQLCYSLNRYMKICIAPKYFLISLFTK